MKAFFRECVKIYYPFTRMQDILTGKYYDRAHINVTK